MTMAIDPSYKIVFWGRKRRRRRSIRERRGRGRISRNMLTI